jgi:hypothetical protein
VTKLLILDEPMTGLTQDPFLETADIDTSNNSWPRKVAPSRVELFKTKTPTDDMMKDYATPLKPLEAKKATP